MRPRGMRPQATAWRAKDSKRSWRLQRKSGAGDDGSARGSRDAAAGDASRRRQAAPRARSARHAARSTRGRWSAVARDPMPVRRMRCALPRSPGCAAVLAGGSRPTSRRSSEWKTLRSFARARCIVAVPASWRPRVIGAVRGAHSHRSAERLRLLRSAVDALLRRQRSVFESGCRAAGTAPRTRLSRLSGAAVRRPADSPDSPNRDVAVRMYAARAAAILKDR